MNTSNTSSDPLFKVGVFGDIQYADDENVFAYEREWRYYRETLEKTKSIINEWNESKDISSIVHVGDLVDCRIKSQGDEQVETCMNRVLSTLSLFKGPVHHVLGNHDFINYNRDVLCDKLNLPHHVYRSFSPHPGFRFIIVDAYDISVLGQPKGHPHQAMAQELLDKNNPNEDKYCFDNMEDLMCRFVPFNGALSHEQLQWLEQEFIDATQQHERVIVWSHVPFHPENADYFAFLWNYDQVLALVNKYKCVAACFYGHYHVGAYFCDNDTQVHHQTMPAMLTTLLPVTLQFYHDRLTFKHDQVVRDMIFRAM